MAKTTKTRAKKFAEDGTRLTDCCGAYSTFHDSVLCCKACHREVEFGQGDGSETRADAPKVVTSRFKVGDRVRCTSVDTDEEANGNWNWYGKVVEIVDDGRTLDVEWEQTGDVVPMPAEEAEIADGPRRLRPDVAVKRVYDLASTLRDKGGSDDDADCLDAALKQRKAAIDALRDLVSILDRKTTATHVETTFVMNARRVLDAANGGAK